MNGPKNNEAIATAVAFFVYGACITVVHVWTLGFTPVFVTEWLNELVGLHLSFPNLSTEATAHW